MPSSLGNSTSANSSGSTQGSSSTTVIIKRKGNHHKGKVLAKPQPKRATITPFAGNETEHFEKFFLSGPKDEKALKNERFDKESLANDFVLVKQPSEKKPLSNGKS